MGKIRVKTFGDEEQEKQEQEKARAAREAKKAAKKAKVAEEPASNAAGAKETEETKVKSEPNSDVIATPSSPRGKQSPAEEKVSEAKEEKKAAPKKKGKFAKESKSRRSKKYLAVATLVDRNKVYSLKEAVELLPKLKLGKFDETVELHINTHEAGISGNTVLPHGTGKTVRVVIADEAVIAAVEKGKIDFDILLCKPEFMGKLAKVAKVLGPRGLMPNPKNGTVTSNPEEAAKKYAGGQVNYKTEAKTPVIHLIVGKVSFGDEKLSANIKHMLAAIQNKNIKNVTLKSTMSPGIKINLMNL